MGDAVKIDKWIVKVLAGPDLPPARLAMPSGHYYQPRPGAAWERVSGFGYRLRLTIGLCEGERVMRID